VWIGFLTYNSTIVVQLLEGSPAQAGVLAAGGSLSQAFAATQAGRITAVFETRLYPLIVSHLGLGLGFGVVLFAPGFSMAIVGVIIMGGCFGTALALYRSVITGLVPASDRGSFVSLTESFGRLSITLSPIFMGGLISILTPAFGFRFSVQMAGLSLAIIVAIGGSVCLLIGSNLKEIDYYE
jgi:MFS family permease